MILKTINVNNSEISDFLGTYYDNSDEYSKVIIDKEYNIIQAITQDGKNLFENVYINDQLLTFCTDEEYYALYLIGEYIAFGVKRDGSFVWFKGLPEHLINYIDDKVENIIQDIEEYIDSSDDIIHYYPHSKMIPLLQNLKLGDYQWGGSSYDQTPLTLLWFSDIHGDDINLLRIKQFYDEYSNYIDDVISCGDFTKGSFYSQFTWWNECGAGNFLNVMGNHDVDSLNTVSEKMCYEKYFEPFIQNWNATYVPNKVYWYKDYPNSISSDCPGGIRLIGTDCYHWYQTEPVSPYSDGTERDTGQQSAWFEAVLNDSLQNKLAVMVALHSPESEATGVTCSFTSLNMNRNSQIKIPSEMILSIQNFINSGGEFICYLTGHTHQDWVANLNNYPQQTVLCVTTAGMNMMWREKIMTNGTKSMDAFDILSIAPRSKHIRIHRVGCEYDRWGRHQGNLIYDYKNKILLQNV